MRRHSSSKKLEKKFFSTFTFICLFILFVLNGILFFSPKIVFAGGDCRCAGQTTGQRTTSLGACCKGCADPRVTGIWQNVFWEGVEKPCDCIRAAPMVGNYERAVEGTGVMTNPAFLTSLNKCCEAFGGEPVIWRGKDELCSCKCQPTNEYKSAITLGDCCAACSVSEGGSVLWNTNFSNPEHSPTVCESNCLCSDGSRKISAKPHECCLACSSHEIVKYEGSNFDCACQADGRLFRGPTNIEECCEVAAKELGKSMSVLKIKIQGIEEQPCAGMQRSEQQSGSTQYQYEPTAPRLQIPLPTLPQLSTFMPLTSTGEPGDRYLLIPWIGEYIAAMYKYAIGITGVLAGIMIVVAGLLWLTAGGDAGRVTTAKSYIEGAMVGLVIALTSYVLLYAINPKLTEFDAMKIRFVERKSLSFAAPGTHTDEPGESFNPQQGTTSGGLLAGATPQTTCRAKILGFGHNGIPEAGIPKADVVKINLSEFPGLDTSPPSGVGGGPQYFLVNKHFEQKMRDALKAAASARLKIYRVGSLRSGDSFRASNLGDPHNFGLAWDINVPTGPWCPFRAGTELGPYNAWATSDAMRVKCAKADPNLTPDLKNLAEVFARHSITWYGRREADTGSVACVKILSESPFRFNVASKQSATHGAPGNLLPPNIKLTDGDQACTNAGYSGYKLVPHLDFMHFQVNDVWTWISNLPGYRECVRDLSR